MLWSCPSSISPADPPRCPEGGICRGCRCAWHAQIMRVSVSRQSQEEVPLDPQGNWSCCSSSHWSCFKYKMWRTFHRHFISKSLDLFLCFLFFSFLFLLGMSRQGPVSHSCNLNLLAKLMVFLRQMLFNLANRCRCWSNQDADFCWAGAILAQNCSEVLETGHYL